jgi:Molecular chaperone GrpE (heat shock protein)
MVDEPQDKVSPEAETAQVDANAQEGVQQEPAAGEVDELAERIQEAVNAALAEQRDMVLRAQAELQTMRRRCEADVEKAHKFALEKFSAELLSVVDNLERALASKPSDNVDPAVTALFEGVELTLKGLLDTFGKYNIQQIDPQGAPFDPQEHEAIAMVPNPAVEPNTVVDVMQKGYSLNGRILRPARVVVAKAS